MKIIPETVEDYLNYVLLVLFLIITFPFCVYWVYKKIVIGE